MSALLLCLLACGPRLQIAHHPIGASSSVSASATRWEAWDEAVRMPFWWLREAVGPLKSFRVPARISIAALACWSVCAALGLGAICGMDRSSEVGKPRPQPADAALLLHRSNAALAFFALLILCDIWRAPLPSFDSRTPRWAAIIRDASGEPQGVVPLPIAFNDWRLSWAMWGQTIHHKPLFCAYLSRAPVGLQSDPVRASALWWCLSTQAQSDDPNERLALRGPMIWPAQAARDLEVWSRQGARFLVWQRGAARPEDEARARQVLAGSGRARLVCEDESAVLWEIVPTPGKL